MSGQISPFKHSIFLVYNLLLSIVVQDVVTLAKQFPHNNIISYKLSREMSRQISS